MKKLIVALTLVLMLPVYSWAGLPVTDPTSYTYYVELLKKDLEKIEKQIENIEQVKKVYEESKKIFESMNGVYSDFQETLQKARAIKQRIEENPTATEDYLAKYLGEDNPDEYLAKNGYVDSRKILDEVFKDVRNPENGTNIYKEAARRRAMQQAALQAAILAGQNIESTLPEEMNQLEKLIEKIGKAKDLKESQDLTNHFLAEILSALQEFKGLMAKFVVAGQMLQFKGSDGSDLNLVQGKKFRSGEISKKIKQSLSKGTSGLKFNEY